MEGKKVISIHNKPVWYNAPISKFQNIKILENVFNEVTLNSVVVIYHVAIVAIGQGLLKKCGQ